MAKPDPKPLGLPPTRTDNVPGLVIDLFDRPVQSARTVGLEIPARRGGVEPDWHDFQIEKDEGDPSDRDLTVREMTL